MCKYLKVYMYVYNLSPVYLCKLNIITYTQIVTCVRSYVYYIFIYISMFIAYSQINHWSLPFAIEQMCTRATRVNKYTNRVLEI